MKFGRAKKIDENTVTTQPIDNHFAIKREPTNQLTNCTYQTIQLLKKHLLKTHLRNTVSNR